MKDFCRNWQTVNDILIMTQGAADSKLDFRPGNADAPPREDGGRE